MNNDFIKFYETKTVDEINQLRKWSLERIEAMDFVLEQKNKEFEQARLNI